MLDQHPITPPPELVEDWSRFAYTIPGVDACGMAKYIATQASQWGADMELEACCEWVSPFSHDDCRYEDKLRAARRPKPPSLKERALAALNVIEDKMLGPTIEEKLIRQALEALDD